MAKDEEREKRLAEALRANLKRRKQQQRHTPLKDTDHPIRTGENDPQP